MLSGAIALALVATALSCSLSPEVQAQQQQPLAQLQVQTGTELMKKKILDEAQLNPNSFDPEDVERFVHDDPGAIGATRFMNQRSQNWRRAARLASSTLKWRKTSALSHLQASDFPCDLFTLGLIFEYGHAHHQDPASGQFVEGNPVIWVRIGALGSVIKHLESLSPARVVSFAYNTPRDAWGKLRGSMRSSQSRASKAARRRDRRRQRLIKNNSVKENETVAHVLRAIAWWLDDWVRRNPTGAKATLVLDFEGTDFAFASWSAGEFFIKLDDLFPDLFDQIIGFRYKPKLWSLHSPISMFNRIFKSRFSSSPETDRKLKFVATEPQISMFVPRVDSRGFTMLPEHVSGSCLGPDSAKAPAGCKQDATAGGLYDPNFWQAIHNEFYYSCKPRAREP